MDPIERLERIAQLKAEAEEGRERIRQRQEERERDPIAYDNFLRAECSSYVAREAMPGELVYKDRYDALVPVRTDDTDAVNAAGWDRWVKAHLAIERAEVLDQVARTVAEFASIYVHEKLQPLRRELADVKAENVEVKRMLGEAVSRFAKLEDDGKALAALLDSECKQHDAARHAFELQVAEMRGRLSAFMRDYTT
jgi:hypothetical protein